MSPTIVLTATIQEIYRASQLKGSRRPSRLRCFFVAMKKGLRIHKMDDWNQYRLDIYRRIITSGPSGNLEVRKIPYRVQENRWGVYETQKTFENGVSYNDGSWLIFNTSRAYKHKDKVIYKDKVFCKDKNQVMIDLYCYILFLRKIGIDVVYEMNYYAVAFLVKYLRFYDKVFDCTRENQNKIGELCRTASNKGKEEIDCESRKDSRQFALDPDMTRKMFPKDIIKWQKRIRKQMTDETIKKWYNPRISVRKNVEQLKANGIEISVGRMYQWIKEYVKE